jgi:hypothetical protein
MLAAIWRIWCFEWDLALLGNAARFPIDCYKTANAELLPVFTGTPAVEFERCARSLHELRDTLNTPSHKYWRQA